jgi:hypothetical protein
MLFPAAVQGERLPPAFRLSLENNPVIDEGLIYFSALLADNASVQLPDGLVLAKGSPFVPSGDLHKGDQIAIKVKATNNGTTQINYALTLTINGKTVVGVPPKQLTLEPGSSQDVVFQPLRRTLE